MISSETGNAFATAAADSVHEQRLQCQQPWHLNRSPTTKVSAKVVTNLVSFEALTELSLSTSHIQRPATYLPIPISGQASLILPRRRRCRRLRCRSRRQKPAQTSEQ